MPKLNQANLNKISIPLPDAKTQQDIVIELDAQSQVLNGLRKMKAEAEKKINQILADVWGVEAVAPVAVEEAEIG